MSQWYHPPLLPMPDVPVGLHQGSFMVRRKFNVHMGVDLYTPVGSTVHAVEAGTVVAVRPFTGKHADSDWWHETWAVDIEGDTGTLCYGEIEPVDGLAVGDEVRSGQEIARVVRLLKEDKGRPTSMLHFALNRHGWKYLYEQNKDPNTKNYYSLQLDPTSLLLQMKAKADMMAVLDLIQLVGRNS